MTDYPTVSTLREIRKWDALKDPVGLVYFVQSEWHWPELFRVKGKRILRIEAHTGGWSGNEEIISELHSNFFWSLYWQKSTRGGHHFFRVPVRRGK
jgi:hypothetical protein